MKAYRHIALLLIMLLALFGCATAPNNAYDVAHQTEARASGGWNSGGASYPGVVADGASGLTITGDITANDGTFAGTVAITSTLLNETPGDHSASPTFALGDGDTGFYEVADDYFTITIGGTQKWQFGEEYFQSVSGAGASIFRGASNSTTPAFRINGDEDTGVGWGGALDQLSLIGGGVEYAKVANGGLSFYRSRIEKTGDAVLTAVECMSTFVTNQGAAGEVDLTLYALSLSAAVTFLVEEAQIIEVNPPTGEAFDLNGTTLDANDCIDSPATVGAKMTCTRMKNAAGAWHWSCDAVRGTWEDTGASD